MREHATAPVESVIRGRYAIEGLLGRSNSGATYLVRDQRSGARGVPPTLFVLEEVVEPNKQARRLLVSEGKRLGRLNHPSLARVQRVLKDDKNRRVFLLREYIEGQGLEALRQQQPGQLFTWPSVMSIMAPIVEALICLHRQRPPIVHGDIRPANIIVRRADGKAVLVDLGRAKEGDAVPHRDADRPCYRAPEQYSGNIDVRADVYALGATFYTLATGKLPPDAPSRTRGAGDPLRPLDSLALAVPLHAARVIDRAMSSDAELRFSSVEQFWDALWLLQEHPAPAPGLSFAREGPPAASGPAPGRVAALTPERPTPQPLPPGPTSASAAEQVDSEPTVRLPGKPKREHAADRVEEPKDPDATVRLPLLPPGVRRAARAEEQREPDAKGPP